WLEPTTPSAPAKEAVRHFIDGRRHPSLAKEGSFARQKISSSSSSAASGCRQLMLIGHLAEARDTSRPRGNRAYMSRRIYRSPRSTPGGRRPSHCESLREALRWSICDR